MSSNLKFIIGKNVYNNNRHYYVIDQIENKIEEIKIELSALRGNDELAQERLLGIIEGLNFVLQELVEDY